MSKRPWSHKIDYAAEIARDEAEIARLNSPFLSTMTTMLAQATAEYPASVDSAWCAMWLVTYKEEGLADRAAALGLTLDDVRAWALVNDDDYAQRHEFTFQRGDWERAEAIDKTHGRDALPAITEKQRMALLKNARASLARHKRNAAKYAA